MPRQAVRSKAESLYSVHPGVVMVQKWIAELPAKTGRSLEAWLKHIRTAGPPTEKERRDWLKREHGLGTNSAWWLADRAEGKGGEDGDPRTYLKAAAEYVEAMYAGAKAGLRPIHDELVKAARKLGKDVKVCPCKTIVPLYRHHVFAEIKPSTRTRIDFGRALGKSKGMLPKRIVPTGGAEKRDRITHRVDITSLQEVDDEIARWLKAAYGLDGQSE